MSDQQPDQQPQPAPPVPPGQGSPSGSPSYPPPPPAGAQPPNPYGQQQQYYQGPAQQRPLSPSDEKLWAMLAWIGAILIGLFAPLIVYLIYKDRSEFVKENSRESLNFHITVTIVSFVGAIALFIVAGLLSAASTTAAGIMIVLITLLLVALGIAVLVVNIMGGLKANSGEIFRVPGIFRFIK